MIQKVTHAGNLTQKTAVRNRWRGAVLWVALIISIVAWLNGCSPDSGVGQTGEVVSADDCDDNLESDSLPVYARKCFEAIGEDVPAFNCDVGGALVPDTLNGSAITAGATCDRPNVLNGECDPGSRFHVLKQTNDVEIVGHCRKKGLGNGLYGDIAVIQYNKKNGATCFYQALDGNAPASGPLPAAVTAPSEGNTGAGKFPWLNPADTAKIHCVRCHDNGPFVRSPYLAQLRDEPTDRLPGTNAGSGEWDHRFSWNQTLPYMFVGSDFQSWKTQSLSVSGTGSLCMSCHRLGINSFNGRYSDTDGTALHLGLVATADTQAAKAPHSATSPIWMTPNQILYSAQNDTAAHAVAACASAIVRKANDSNEKDPPAGCQSVRLAQGNTCRSGPVRVVVNGATQSSPSSDRSDVVVPSGMCTNNDCPPGFCYWVKLHGPFWQTSSSSVPIGDANYRGSFVQIYGDGGIWVLRAFSDPTGGPPNAPPGGIMECTRFNEIAAIPDTAQCFSKQFSIVDKDGTHFSDSADATVAGATTVNLLSGLIGNIAQANTGAANDNPDYLRVFETRGKVQLAQSHSPKPLTPLKLGPLTGESWTTGCNAWTADYVAKDVYTTSDVPLVPATQSKNVRCFITGVTGAWSSTRSGATIQPFAEIYFGASKEIRLRVSPANGDADHVGAYASCIRLR